MEQQGILASGSNVPQTDRTGFAEICQKTVLSGKIKISCLELSNDKEISCAS